MPVIMFSSVDLPLPDLPTIETNSPRLMVRSMPLRTVNSPAAFLNVLTMPVHVDHGLRGGHGMLVGGRLTGGTTRSFLPPPTDLFICFCSNQLLVQLPVRDLQGA
jgi:hypothetical protein